MLVPQVARAFAVEAEYHSVNGRVIIVDERAHAIEVAASEAAARLASKDANDSAAAAVRPAAMVIAQDCLRHAFHPRATLDWLCGLTIPDGGRLIYAQTLNDEYVELTPKWLLDYFVAAQYADCRVYLLWPPEKEPAVATFDYRWMLKNAQPVYNETWDNITHAAAIVLVAERGRASHHGRPSQDIYRGVQQWNEYSDVLRRFITSKRPWHLTSAAPPFLPVGCRDTATPARASRVRDRVFGSAVLESLRRLITAPRPKYLTKRPPILSAACGDPSAATPASRRYGDFGNIMPQLATAFAVETQYRGTDGPVIIVDERSRAVAVSASDVAPWLADKSAFQDAPPATKPAGMVVAFDCLRHAFHPRAALDYLSRLAVLEGGRLIYAQTLSDEYVELTPKWLLDYFVAAQYADCRVYLLWPSADAPKVATFDFDWMLENAQPIYSEMWDNVTYAAAIVLVAERGPASHRGRPSQDIYRGVQQWDEYSDVLRRFIASKRPWHLTGALPEVMPSGYRSASPPTRARRIEYRDYGETAAVIPADLRAVKPWHGAGVLAPTFRASRLGARLRIRVCMNAYLTRTNEFVVAIFPNDRSDRVLLTKHRVKRGHREILDHTFEMEARTATEVYFVVRVGLAKKWGIAYINGSRKGPDRSLPFPFVEIVEVDLISPLEGSVHQ